MKTLITLSLLIVGYFGYQYWTARESLPPPSEPDAEMEVEQSAPVHFSVKMRVKRILDEWKNESLQVPGRPRRASLVDIRGEITEIRRRLQSEGRHDEPALRDIMVRAAVELGYAPDQAALLVREVSDAYSSSTSVQEGCRETMR
jgi:hypothetical protein